MTCSPSVGMNDLSGRYFWHCPTHAIGNFGMPTRDDALAAAHEHARKFEGTPE